MTDNTSTKRCARCGEVFPIEMMGTYKKNGKVYVGSWCPECTLAVRNHHRELRNARARQRTAERRAAMAPKEGHKYCACCHKEKPLSEFYPSKYHNAGYASYCKECSREDWKKRHKPVPKGVFFDDSTGKLIDRRTPYPQPFWSENMLNILRRYYPISPTREVSELVGLSCKSVTKKAKQLGLSKSREYIQKMNAENGILGGIANKRRIQKLKQSQQPSVK